MDITRAQERLDGLRAAIGEAYGRQDWDAIHGAYREMYPAERDLARARGEQYAEPLDIGMRWDTGAPIPHVLSGSGRTIVLFLLSRADPDWDGSYVRVVDRRDPAPVPLGLVEFAGAYLTSFGGLNDEAIEGHPLSGRGLEPYGCHVVRDSAWLAAAERANSVHRSHRGGWHERLDHYVLCFHDETFECIARGWHAETLTCSMPEALARAAARLVTR